MHASDLPIIRWEMEEILSEARCSASATTLQRQFRARFGVSRGQGSEVDVVTRPACLVYLLNQLIMYNCVRM
jgi:hypothetical protein